MRKLIFRKELTLIKSNKSKECLACHYWFFKDIVYKFEQYVCNKCHDISMMPDELENTAVLNWKDVDYRCLIWAMTKNIVMNRLNDSKPHDKGTLWIWILVLIKHSLKWLKKVSLKELVLEIFILVLMVNCIESYKKNLPSQGILIEIIIVQIIVMLMLIGVLLDLEHH